MRLDYNKHSYWLKIYFLEVHMGNNAIVGQSGGPTSVINASLAGVFQACVMRGANRVYGMLNGVAGLLDDRVTDLTATLGSSLEIELLKRTPSSYLGSCRYKLPDSLTHPDVYEKLFAILKKLDIGYFFYIGGNDSMDTICKLSDYAKRIGSDIRFMGVPKTIDNDLMHTDHTPGYGSAAKYIGVVMKEIIRDATVYGTNYVTIVEIMGRNAGWLTAAAALARGEDCEGVNMICLPEVPFGIEHFMDKVERMQRESRSVVIAVSEGVKLADGRYVCELSDDAHFVDAFGHKSLTGIGPNEVYSAIKQGTIDGAENNWPTYQNMGDYEAATFYVLDEHTRVPEILLASAEVLSSLDPADVEIIKQCAIETEAYEKAKWAEKEESSEKIVREAGCTIVELTPEAFAEFQAAMTNPSDALGGQSLYEKYGAKYQDVIDAITKVGEAY